MAATKECICICLDVGMSMLTEIEDESSRSNQSQSISYFKRAVKLLTMFLERKIFSESKDEVCIVLFGSDETENDLAAAGEDEYQHIKVFSKLQLAQFETIDKLHQISASTECSADFCDAIIVGLDLMHKSSQGKRFARQRIFVFSALMDEFNDDKEGIEEMSSALKGENVELSIIGLDNLVDTPSSGSGSGNSANTSQPGPSNRSPSRRSTNGSKLMTDTQKRALHTINSIHSLGVEGNIYSFSDVTAVMQFFVSKEAKVSGWSVNLEIGSIEIPVVRYIKVKSTSLKSWEKLSYDGPGNAPSKVKMTRSNYTVVSEADGVTKEDGTEAVEGEEIEIDADRIVKGFRYGCSLIPVTDADEEAMKIATQKCLKIVGFAKEEQIVLEQVVGDSTWVVLPPHGNEDAALALSALIQACKSCGRVPVARYAYNKASNPRLVALLPTIDEKNNECFIGVQLPYADDVRLFVLPSFENLPEKMKPSSNQQSAMDLLIDSTRLDEGTLGEYRLSEAGETFSPIHQRTYQCLSHKRRHPDEDLPDPDETIAKCIQPEQVVLMEAAASIEQVQSVFETKVVAKSKGAATGQNLFTSDNGQSGTENATSDPVLESTRLHNITSLNDVTSNGVDQNRSSLTISSKTAVQDFKALLNSTCSSVASANDTQVDYSQDCEKVEDKITEFITNSFNDEFFNKALQLLKAYREESISRNFVAQFNKFLINLRDLLKSRRKEKFLDVLKESKTTLISKSESRDSDVSAAEATSFIEGDSLNTSGQSLKESADPTDNVDDESDLLALLD